MNAKIDNLGTMAAEVAMRAAVDFLKTGKATGFNGTGRLSDDEVGTLVTLLRKHAKAAVGSALEDAGKAIAAGMTLIAEQTFRTTMALAGIKAAKEFLGVQNG